MLNFISDVVMFWCSSGVVKVQDTHQKRRTAFDGLANDLLSLLAYIPVPQWSTVRASHFLTILCNDVVDIFDMFTLFDYCTTSYKFEGLG